MKIPLNQACERLEEMVDPVLCHHIRHFKEEWKRGHAAWPWMYPISLPDLGQWGRKFLIFVADQEELRK